MATGSYRDRHMTLFCDMITLKIASEIALSSSAIYYYLSSVILINLAAVFYGKNVRKEQFKKSLRNVKNPEIC